MGGAGRGVIVGGATGASNDASQGTDISHRADGSNPDQERQTVEVSDVLGSEVPPWYS